MDYNKIRKKTKPVILGGNGIRRCVIGGDAAVSIQTMLNTDPSDFESCLEQARLLQDSGADLIRLTVPSKEDASVIYRLHNSGIIVPLVADIHFDYKIALEAISAGADKIRINPGNIGGDDRVKEVAKACLAHNVPIRIGVNSGSLETDILKKYGTPTSEALYESAMYHISLLQKYDFDNIVISVKSSDVKTMIEAYRLLSANVKYPLHLGVTEAGSKERGAIKSAVGIGSLLCDGIGDTIRVSLTAHPSEEIAEGRRLLDVLGISDTGIEIISCPTCGRTKVNLIALVKEFETKVSDIKVGKKIKVAIMGCAVNGPGEARGADFGVACGGGCGLIFEAGEILKKVSEDEIIDTLVEMCKDAAAL